MPRRTSFAASYVLVGSLLAPGCANPKPPLVSPPTEEGGDPIAALPDAPEGTGAWTRQDDAWVYVYDQSRTRMYLGADGRCRVEPDASCGNDGPVVSTCNPPPVYEVRCPADTPGR